MRAVGLFFAFAWGGFAASASFVTADLTTQGNWKGTYGTDGYNVIGDSSNYPSYATITATGNSSYVWASSTSDPRALQKVTAADRVAATWYSSTSFTIDINFTDSTAHKLAVYCVDWENSGRAEIVDVSDASSAAVLDTRTLSGFGTGQYLVWSVTGHVTLRFTRSAGSNVVLSGLFLGTPAGSGNPTSSASFIKADISTMGSWNGVYGADGHYIFADSLVLPAYLPAVTPSGAATYTWVTSTSDPRALQTGSGTSRIASTLYSSTSFSIDLNLTGGTAHQIAAYFLDWDNGKRAQKIDILDAGTGSVLDSRNIASFTNGQYLVWNIQGHVTMRITNSSASNAVLNGLFFGVGGTVGGGGGTVTSSAVFNRLDSGTHGSWIGSYGNEGYNVVNDSAKYPAYAQVNPGAAASFTWTASAIDGRALSTGSGLSRIAATWYSSSSFKIDVNLTDQNAHTVALYCLDWDAAIRTQTVDILDSASGAVLDSRSISTFEGGVYLVWSLKGHVSVRITPTGRGNAVVSGIFFGQTLAAPANPTQTENSRPGSSNWALSNPATNHEIEGYASLTSVASGGQISLFVNTADPTYTMDIFRMGWYNGAGARLVMGGISLPGIRQPAPIPAPTTGLIECNWSNPYLLTIPAGSDPWPSGVYLVKLTASVSGRQSYIIFVVRDDARHSNFLVQTSVTTYQAYNNWGGKSLYDFNSTNGPARKVSFNRPYALGSQIQSGVGIGAGHFLTNAAPVQYTVPAGWEYNMVRFLEREGYDVTYCTDLDTHENPSLLLSHKGFLVVGHDEYWSWQQRANVEAARDQRVNLGFFGGNICYWQIRFEPSLITGAANRTQVAYKEVAPAQDPFALDSDPANDRFITTYWRANSVKPPEDAFIGVMYFENPVNSDIIVTNTTDPAFALTGLYNGIALTGLLGYEVDRASGNAPATLIVLGGSPTPSGLLSNMTIYSAPSGAAVFAAGSIQWSWGLDDDYFAAALRTSRLNPAAQQITRNVLKRFLQ
jgi:hypothetical protein